jgi:acyl-CoA synthetase (AMP-forming)/AMP-acid ligase II
MLATQSRFHGRRTAVVDGERAATFADLAARSSRLADALADLGCRRGDRVAILARNSLELVEWFFACAAGGYIGLALNTRLGTQALQEMLADADPSVVLVDGRERELADELRSIGALSAPEVGFGEGHGCGRDYETLLTDARGDLDLPFHDGETPLLLTATSGTTGKVKMTLHSHLGVFTGLQCTQASLRTTPQSRVLTALPMFFATATGGYWVGVFTGAETHLLPAFDAESFVHEVDRSGITHAIVGPSPLYQVMDAGINIDPLRRLDFLGAGGAPFDSARFGELHERLGGNVAPMYSMSELSFSCVLRPEDVVTNGRLNDKVGSAGRPQPGSHVWVLDDDGEAVDADGSTMGEVVFFAPGIATRYWSGDEESSSTFVDGCVRSGDLATIDSDGFLRIVDRKKDLIVTGGINVAPLEVENAIARHPDVAYVAVVGAPHPMWGEAIHAVVVARPGAKPTEEEILRWAADALPPVKRPKSVDFVDALPINITGKVLRRVLRDQRAGRTVG